MSLKFCHEKIRTLIRDNFLKICEIGEGMWFQFRDLGLAGCARSTTGINVHRAAKPMSLFFVSTSTPGCGLKSRIVACGN